MSQGLKITKLVQFSIIVILLTPLILFQQLPSTIIKTDQNIEEDQYLNYNSQTRYSRSTTQDLSIASIILNHYFLHNTIITEMEISFLGSGTQNVSEEQFIVAGEISNIVINSEGEPTNFQSEYKNQLNQTEINITINELIPKGQYYILELRWEQTISIESPSSHNISVYWNKEIGISAMKVVLSLGYSYVDATNPPDQVKPEEDELILRWTEIFKESFTCSIQTLYQEPHFEEEVIITPAVIEINENGNQIVNFVIITENIGNSTLQIIIHTEQFQLLNSSSTLLKPSEKFNFVFESDLREENSIKSNVTIQVKYFNGSQSIILIPVEISIQNNIDIVPIIIFLGIIIIFAFASVIGYKNKTKIRRYLLNLKNKTLNTIDYNVVQESEDPKPTRLSLSSDQLETKNIDDLSIILNNYRNKLKEKEFSVFEILLRNPFGHSQAELCELTNISKSTMSRIIGQLEIQQLVTREKSGMSKIVKVKEKFMT